VPLAKDPVDCSPADRSVPACDDAPVMLNSLKAVAFPFSRLPSLPPWRDHGDWCPGVCW